MIRFEKLEPWHVEVMRSMGHLESLYVEGYAEYVCQGEAVAVFLDEELVAMGGIIPMWGRVYDGWSVLTDKLRAKPVLLVKAFRRFFCELSTDYQRLQITVEEEFEKAQAFAEFLGFTPEGRMEYYSPTGTTHIRYARIR